MRLGLACRRSWGRRTTRTTSGLQAGQRPTTSQTTETCLSRDSPGVQMGPFVCCSLGHMLQDLVAVLVHGANSVSCVNGVNGVAGVNRIGAESLVDWKSRKPEPSKSSKIQEWKINRQS